MTDTTPSLLPCPFCGAGETRIDEQTYWTGMRSQVSSVNLRHFCADADDAFVKASITIRARTREQAAAAWNTRAALKEGGADAAG